MNVQCACGNWHRLTPTALVVVLQAFVDGDLQHVSRTGGHIQIASVCFMEAFTPERTAETLRRYPGHSIRMEP